MFAQINEGKTDSGNLTDKEAEKRRKKIEKPENCRRKCGSNKYLVVFDDNT